jgi:hypothetical protein
MAVTAAAAALTLQRRWADGWAGEGAAGWGGGFQCGLHRALGLGLGLVLGKRACALKSNGVRLPQGCVAGPTPACSGCSTRSVQLPALHPPGACCFGGPGAAGLWAALAPGGFWSLEQWPPHREDPEEARCMGAAACRHTQPCLHYMGAFWGRAGWLAGGAACCLRGYLAACTSSPADL